MCFINSPALAGFGSPALAGFGLHPTLGYYQQEAPWAPATNFDVVVEVVPGSAAA